MRTMEELVAEIRSFPLVDRLRLIERIVHDMAEASASEASSTAPPPPRLSPIGWLADEPELAEELDKLTREARVRGRVRVTDDENSH